MHVRYFRETDTALLEFANAPVVETREISEDVYVDFDAAGHVVSMTIEHAAGGAGLPRVVVEDKDERKRPP